MCVRALIDSCQCYTAENSLHIVLPRCAIWISQRRPPLTSLTAHRAVYRCRKNLSIPSLSISPRIPHRYTVALRPSGDSQKWWVAPCTGSLQYVQHGGLKPSPQTLMSSAPELRMYNIHGANNDSENEGDNPNTATGWRPQQALCVFSFLV